MGMYSCPWCFDRGRWPLKRPARAEEKTRARVLAHATPREIAHGHLSRRHHLRRKPPPIIARRDVQVSQERRPHARLVPEAAQAENAGDAVARFFEHAPGGLESEELNGLGG